LTRRWFGGGTFTGVLAVAALVLGLARPPAAYVEPGHVQLAVSSWCWGAHCGAPIAASGRSVTRARGDLVRVDLPFVPSTVRVAVGGARVLVLRHGGEISWRVRRGGGITINTTGATGFVTYVGRLVVR
jgi:hypothetical protein